MAKSRTRRATIHGGCTRNKGPSTRGLRLPTPTKRPRSDTTGRGRFAGCARYRERRLSLACQSSGTLQGLGETLRASRQVWQARTVSAMGAGRPLTASMMPSPLNESQDQHASHDGGGQSLPKWNRYPGHQRSDTHPMRVLNDEHNCNEENHERQEMARDESPSAFLLFRGRNCLVRHEATTTHPARPAKSPGRVCSLREAATGWRSGHNAPGSGAASTARGGARLPTQGGAAHAHPRRRCK